MLNDQELISLVLTHPADTHQQLADRVGLPVRTLTYRLTRPGFREKLAIVRSCYIEDAAADAVSSIKEVLDTLRKEMRNQSAFPSERVKAATEFGKLAMKLHEMATLTPRLVALEAFIAQQANPENPRYVFEVDSDGERLDRWGDPIEDDPADVSAAGRRTHQMTQAGRSTGGQGDSTGEQDRAADANQSETLTLAPEVAKRFDEIISNFTQDK